MRCYGSLPRAAGPAFHDSGLLLKAVLADQGAGLLPAAMATLDLAEGRLVKLADVVLLEDFAYYLVYPEISHERPKVAAFRTWLLDAAIGKPSAAPHRVELAIRAQAGETRHPVRHGEERGDRGDVPDVVVGEPVRAQRVGIGVVDQV